MKMKQLKKTKLKLKYTLNNTSEKERNDKINKSFDILFDEVSKRFKK